MIAAARGVQPNARIILDVAHVEHSGGEAATAVSTFSALTPLSPGAQALIYDGALRGVHHQPFLRNMGLLMVSRVAAAQRIRNKSGKSVRRVDKVVYVETKTVNRPTGPTAV